jgi:hypothetical protein
MQLAGYLAAQPSNLQKWCSCCLAAIMLKTECVIVVPIIGPGCRRGLLHACMHESCTCACWLALQRCVIILPRAVDAACQGTRQAAWVPAQWQPAPAAAHRCSAAAASLSSFSRPIMVWALLCLMTDVSALIAATATAMSGARARASWNSFTTVSLMPATARVEGNQRSSRRLWRD